jgi:hypothetical protein
MDVHANKFKAYIVKDGANGVCYKLVLMNKIDISYMAVLEDCARVQAGLPALNFPGDLLNEVSMRVLTRVLAPCSLL